MDMHPLVYLKWRTNKDLPYGPESSAPYVAAWRGVWGRMDTYICMAESLCYLPETVSTLLIN